jgi:hypothetical protein
MGFAFFGTGAMRVGADVRDRPFGLRRSARDADAGVAAFGRGARRYGLKHREKETSKLTSRYSDYPRVLMRGTQLRHLPAGVERTAFTGKLHTSIAENHPW